MKKENFNLCNSCKLKDEDKCSMYKKNPEAMVKDCGRFVYNQKDNNILNVVSDVLANK